MQDEYTATSKPSNESQSGVASIGNPGGSIRSALEPARAKLANAVDTVQEKSNQAISGMTGYIQESPMRSVAMAMGIGVIIGLLLGDRGYAPWRGRSGW
jgi:ElaB/YqjD/DUF883 family membrane-anchored ribosome-binding protein